MYNDPEKVYRKCYRYLAKSSGYQTFGFDWPTLRLTHPHLARVMWECLQQILKGHSLYLPNPAQSILYTPRPIQR